MASIDTLKASDGTGAASVATVQSVRAPAATTLVVDTVQGINSTFHATMGTPHTFVDPVTSETITVISEATAVDFQGHVDGTNLEIDVIAPGFTDNGSSANDIVIIKPTTQWADEVADVLEVSHDDDGTLKDDTVGTDQLVDLNVTTAKIANDNITATKIDWASTGANGGIWWEELGRTTLGTAGDSITVSSLPARKYLKVLITVFDTGGTIGGNLQFNGDTATNYAFTYSIDGAAAVTSATSTAIFGRAGTQACAQRCEANIFNIATDEKVVTLTATCNNAAGAATVPSGIVVAGKWVNTSDAISSVTYVNGGTGDFAIGSEVVVLGHN